MSFLCHRWKIKIKKFSLRFWIWSRYDWNSKIIHIQKYMYRKCHELMNKTEHFLPPLSFAVPTFVVSKYICWSPSQIVPNLFEGRESFARDFLFSIDLHSLLIRQVERASEPASKCMMWAWVSDWLSYVPAWCCWWKNNKEILLITLRPFFT